jgi:hypothetical protein
MVLGLVAMVLGLYVPAIATLCNLDFCGMTTKTFWILLLAAACLLAVEREVRAQSALEKLEQQIRQRNSRRNADNNADPNAASSSGIGANADGTGVRESAYLGLVADDSNDRGRGVRVLSIRPGSPAERAGIRRYDMITSIAGTRVRQMSDLSGILGTFSPGQIATFDLLRDGKKQSVKVAFGRRPGDVQTPATVMPPSIPPDTTNSTTPTTAQTTPSITPRALSKKPVASAVAPITPSNEAMPSSEAPPSSSLSLPEPPMPPELVATPSGSTSNQRSGDSKTVEVIPSQPMDTLPEPSEQPVGPELLAPSETAPKTSATTKVLPPVSIQKNETVESSASTASNSKALSNERMEQLQRRIDELERHATELKQHATKLEQRVAELERALEEAKKTQSK